MATMILRDLKPLPEAEGLYRRWISHLNEQFTLHGQRTGGGDCARRAVPDLPGAAARQPHECGADQ